MDEQTQKTVLPTMREAVMQLTSVDYLCAAGEYAEALKMLDRLERTTIPALRQEIREAAAPTIDYDAYVREIVTRESKVGRGASLTYSFTNYRDARFDRACVQEAIDRLVASGELVLKNQRVYTPDAWEHVRQERAKRRAEPHRDWRRW